MRYVVYGAGAVGGVVGGHLARAGIVTTLIDRGEHLVRMQAHGLVLDTGAGRHVVHTATAASAAEIDWAHDVVVLLAIKSHQASAALADLASHAPSDTPIVCLTNGVATEPAALRRFPRVSGISAMLLASHVEPGVVVANNHPVPGIVDIGRFPAGSDAVDEAVALDLRTAGFSSETSTEIMAWKYRKLVMNAGNGVDATCQPGTAADELIRLAEAEAKSVVQTAGLPLVPATQVWERCAEVLSVREDSPVSDGHSTWQSIERGNRETEIDYLAGEVVLLGRLHGVPTPACELVQRSTADLARRGDAPRSLDPAELLARLAD